MRRAWHALAAYFVITLAATWPLVRGIATDVAWDIGDSALNMWVLSWDCEQLLGILHGDFSRIATFFDGNIFYPAPLTLAYAEHLFAQAVQILPVYAATQNPILCYNLLFLSTFILSGLGTYLFVRELTGKPVAAFVAGLLFAFAPYRLPQSPHLQVLSSQWMPFALYGFHRYFTAVQHGERGARPLAGASLALVAENLSCGYYLLYFLPFAAAYAIWEIAGRGLTRRLHVWLSLSAAALLVAIITLPFLLPYAALRAEFGFERPAAEVRKYSADVYSYATAMQGQPIWGQVLREHPKPEGDLFPGLVPLVLCLVGLAAWRAPRFVPSVRPRIVRSVPWLTSALSVLCVLHLLLALVTLANRRIGIDLGPLRIQITDINQMLIRALAAAALVLLLSPATRARVRAFAVDRGFLIAVLIAAVWLSFGIVVEVHGRVANLVAPYSFLFQHVPGFDGVRVPARFAMIAALALATLGGYGAAVLTKSRPGLVVLGLLSTFFLAESLIFPFLVNASLPLRTYNTPEARLYRPSRAPSIYRETARLPATAVLAELPLGEPDFDFRAVYYSTVHWRRLLNGYSGFFPPHYGRLALALSDVPRFPEVALDALRQQRATHVIVHEEAFKETRGPQTTAALIASGGREIFRAGSDVLLALPSPP